MELILIGLAIVAALVAGVGLMLYSDHKEHKRMVQNGGRRF